MGLILVFQKLRRIEGRKTENKNKLKLLLLRKEIDFSLRLMKISSSK